MKRLFVFLATIISVVIMGICVYADDVDSTVELQPSGEINSVCVQANNSVGKKVKILSYSKGLVTFSNKTYSQLDIESKRVFMETALSATQETHLGSQQKNKLYNFIADQDSTTSAAIRYLKSDASADFVAAKAWFRPFSGPISTVIGVICILVFMFMGFSMLFDCAYLCLPAFQALLERGEHNRRPFGVSREAYITMKEIYKPAMQSRNIMSVYFGKRVPVLIICAICLGYIVSGKIYDIMSFFVDAFSNF